MNEDTTLPLWNKQHFLFIPFQILNLNHIPHNTVVYLCSLKDRLRSITGVFQYGIYTLTSRIKHGGIKVRVTFLFNLCYSMNL